MSFDFIVYIIYKRLNTSFTVASNTDPKLPNLLLEAVVEGWDRFLWVTVVFWVLKFKRNKNLFPLITKNTSPHLAALQTSQCSTICVCV